MREECLDVASGHGRFDRESLGHPSGDLVAVRSAVQNGPHERGGRVQLVNAPTRPIEDHDFTLDISYGETGTRLQRHGGVTIP